MRPFSINRIALSLLPTALRRPALVALLRAAISGLASCYDAIDTAHNHSLRGTYAQLRRNGQVNIMEAALNDLHDPAQRRIRIDPFEGREPFYIYTDVEIEKAPSLYGRWLFHDIEPTIIWAMSELVAVASPMGFIVLAPAEANTPSLRATIDGLRIAGTHYRIVEEEA